MSTTSRIRTRNRTIALAAALAVVVSSCSLVPGQGDDDAGPNDEITVAAVESGLDEAGTPTRGGQLVYGLEAEVGTTGYCLPEAELAISGMQVARSLYDTLTVPDEDGEYVPYLAKALDHDDSYKEWTISLRPGITFHDGSSLDADVVKNNLDAYRGQYPGRSPLLFTFVLGNIDDPSRIADQVQRMEQLGHDFGAAARALVEAIRSAPPPDPSFPVVPQEEHPWLASLAEAVLGDRHPAITLGSAWVRVAEVLAHMLDTLVAGALSSELFQPLAKLLGWAAPHLIDTILSPFVALGKDGAPATQHFQDSWYLGLPMDNGMDDLLMPTYFTEIWIPFTEAGGEVQQAIAALRKLFDADGTAEGCYAATGPFSIELYATKAGQTFFLDPAYGDKDVFRVDVFWFGYNGGSPQPRVKSSAKMRSVAGST